MVSASHKQNIDEEVINSNSVQVSMIIAANSSKIKYSKQTSKGKLLEMQKWERWKPNGESQI